ncbi:hypothetical protein BGZ99_008472 [Dissophora globulifera]|uniref:DUF1772-domain-containing protein n=1 Tax=Dissophora globulifera TaxID=979702 RepID=A0A9P6UPL8_9FUNG|nr:hypothetical protein BGZ99_008472 [Dissophora globulifera]
MPVATPGFRALASTANFLLATNVVTVAAMGIFAGSALHSNTVVMPALRNFASSSSLAVWAEIYLRGRPLQVVTVAISSLGASALFYKTRNPYYLAGAALIAAIAPYTSLLLYPINHQLLDFRKHGRDDPAVEEMLVHWSTIQSGRTLLSCSAMVVTLYGALQGHKLTL